MNIGSYIETFDVTPVDPFDLVADEPTELETLALPHPSPSLLADAFVATEGRAAAIAVAERIFGGDWPTPGVVIAGPAGSGTTTMVEAVADRLQLTGTACVSGDAAGRIDRTNGAVAIVDRLGAVDTAKAVLALVRDGWHVLAAVEGIGIAVEEAFAALVRAGRVSLVELPALERPVREHVLARALPGEDASVVDLLARAGPGDGVALGILAARTIARAGLARGGVDVDAAAAALRSGQGVRTDAPPSPVHIDHLVRGPVVPPDITLSLSRCLQPLLVLGRLAAPIAAVEPGVPLAVAGGHAVGVAHRAALHHALAGRSVLMLSALQREDRVADQLVTLAGGERRGDGTGPAIVGRLPIAVLADAARSLVDVPAVVRRVRPFVGFEPEVVVVDGRTFDGLDAVAAMSTPVVVVADAGATGPGAVWGVDDCRPHVAIRPPGRRWERVASPSAADVDRNGLATDETGAVRAWRLWQLVIDADGVALGSPVRSTVWPRGVITSTCGRCGSTPAGTCTCGIYAFSDPSRALASWRQHPELVFGELRCWGRIVRHDDGVRAQYAQPVLLHLGAIGSESERLALTARYGCDVTGR